MTRREEIIQMLKEQEMSLQHLANHFKTDLKELHEDFEHVKYTARKQGGLVMRPAECRSCGFVFKERSKIKTPTKCPKCREERIFPPRFRIVDKKAKKKREEKVV